MGSGDISRNTFDPKKHYTGVRMQQGRVILDDDWNESARQETKYIRRCLGHFERNCPFSVASLVLHNELIRTRLHWGRDYGPLLADKEFAESLHRILKEWRMDRRGASLRPLGGFRRRLTRLGKEPELHRLGRLSIHDVSKTNYLDVARRTWGMINLLDPVTTKSVLVTGTKALHHVLPLLVPPVDTRYTLGFLSGSMPSGNRHQVREREGRVFARVLRAFAIIARANRRFIDETVARERSCRMSFNTSAPKVIDNAIVGYVLKHPRKPRNRT